MKQPEKTEQSLLPIRAALLALALLLEVVPLERAQNLQYAFANEVIEQLPKGRSPLSLSRKEILAWVLHRNQRQPSGDV